MYWKYSKFGSIYGNDLFFMRNDMIYVFVFCVCFKDFFYFFIYVKFEYEIFFWNMFVIDDVYIFILVMNFIK